MYIDSSDLELIDDSDYLGLQIVGMRFQGVSVPQDSTITSSFIEFEADETDSVGTSLTFYGEYAGNAAAFADVAFNVSDRTSTTASVNWSPAPWLTVSEKHQTPDLSEIVEEIVGHSGWTSGNNMVFVVDGSGERTAEAYEGESENAPLLCVAYGESPETVCGDGIVDAGEECDDGGTTDGDGCDASCNIEADFCPCNMSSMSTSWFPPASGLATWIQFVGSVAPPVPPVRVAEECNVGASTIELVDYAAIPDTPDIGISVDQTVPECTAFSRPVAGADTVIGTFSLTAAEALSCEELIRDRAATQIPAVTCM